MRREVVQDRKIIIQKGESGEWDEDIHVQRHDDDPVRNGEAMRWLLHVLGKGDPWVAVAMLAIA
jgi:hypothetical protein